MFVQLIKDFHLNDAHNPTSYLTVNTHSPYHKDQLVNAVYENTRQLWESKQTHKYAVSGQNRVP